MTASEHNMKSYMASINTDETYRITVKDFRQWLRDKNMTAEFERQLRDEDLTLYDIALDFAIPVSMVKYFRRSA